YNVRHLYRVMESELERAKRFGSSFSLVFIDLDHFKRVNDVHGHLTGRRLLADVGQALRGAVREVDSVFRYGGDEFIVLLPETRKEASRDIAEKLPSHLRSL